MIKIWTHFRVNNSCLVKILDKVEFLGEAGKFGFVKILDGSQDFDKVKKSWLVKILDDDQDLIKFTNQEKLVSQESWWTPSFDQVFLIKKSWSRQVSW